MQKLLFIYYRDSLVNVNFTNEDFLVLVQFKNVGLCVLVYVYVQAQVYV